MRYRASEKAEIIELVEQSHLPAKRTLEKLGIPRATFYRWYDRYREGGIEALADHRSRPDRVWNRIQVLPQTPEKGMADFSLRRLRTVLDLREQLGFDPDAPVCDALGVRLCFPDQGLQSLLQIGGGSLVEAMVDLARVDEILALAPADIDAVPLPLVERETRDSQRLPSLVRPFG
jgi:transposase-like protein